MTRSIRHGFVKTTVPKALILDLGDVIFNWKPPTDGKISPKTFRRAMSTLPWHELECGRLSETECFSRIGSILSIHPSDVEDSVRRAELSLQCDDSFVEKLKEFKRAGEGNVKLYAMSNIAREHYDIVRSKPWDWDLFDRIFTSGECGMRKPDLNFFDHVLEAIGLVDAPEEAVFVDDKLENVFSARSVGMQGIIFEDRGSVVRQLENLFGDPVKRGNKFLLRNAKNMHSETTNGLEMKENFAQLLILEATGNRDLVEFATYPFIWNFFPEQPVATTTTFPNDFDTTSLALTLLGDEYSIAHAAMDKALTNINADGIVLLYDDPNRPRLDTVMCVHTYTLFNVYGRASELAKTYNWILRSLRNRAYTDGTYYYSTPEYFLYALSRLVTYSARANRGVPSELLLLFRARCEERIGAPGDALAVAMRIIACTSVGIKAEKLQREVGMLRDLQCADGGWPFCGMYRVPLAKIEIGNRGVSTAMAVKALGLAGVEERGIGSAELVGKVIGKINGGNNGQTNSKINGQANV